MTRQKEERQRSLKNGSVAELAGHYRPKDLAETKEGPCWLWNSRADEFMEAVWPWEASKRASGQGPVPPR